MGGLDVEEALTAVEECLQDQDASPEAIPVREETILDGGGGGGRSGEHERVHAGGRPFPPALRFPWPQVRREAAAALERFGVAFPEHLCRVSLLLETLLRDESPLVLKRVPPPTYLPCDCRPATGLACPGPLTRLPRHRRSPQ